MSRNCARLLTILLCILLVNSTLLFRSASDISEIQRLKEISKQQKLALFTTTGFSSSRGKAMIKSITEYIESMSSSDNLTGVVNIDFNDEIKLLSLPSRGVLPLFAYYVDSIHFQGGDSRKLVVDLSIYFEQIVRCHLNDTNDKKRAKVIFILGASSQQNEENNLQLKILLQNSINEAWSLVPKILVDKLHNVDDYLEINFMNENSDNLVTLINEVIADNNILIEPKISNQVSTQINKKITNMESLYVYDINIENDIFFTNLNRRINEIYLNDNLSMDGIHLFLDNLNNLVDDYNKNTKLNELLSTNSLYGLRTRVRLNLSTVLYSLFRNIAQTIRLNTINSFDTTIKSTKPNSKLPQILDSMVHEYVNKFDESMEILIGKFEKIINISSNNGIFTNQSKLPNKQIEGLFCYKNDHNTVYEKLKSFSSDRQLYLFTQGAYNPYTRDKPYPPIRINLSYLFNPKSALFNFDYNKMYDEHREGPTLNRADALYIPGVAKFPFDLNDHAFPKENRKWYQILVDLYLN